MSRMKRFFIYFILLVVTFFGVRILSEIGIKNTYVNINNYQIKTTSPIIEVTDSKKTNVNGYVKGKITNNQEQYISDKYLKINLYNEEGEKIGIKAVKVEKLSPGSTVEFDIHYKYSNVDGYTLEITDEEIDYEDVVKMDFIPNFVAENYKWVLFGTSLFIIWKYGFFFL